jgi:branched-chain amino acid transport system substrate-binding protein
MRAIALNIIIGGNEMKLKKILALMTVSLMILLCIVSANAAETVKVGVLLPFSGGSAAMGQEFEAGMKMAVSNFNAAGGVKSMGGAEIELVWADSAGDPQTGVTEIERLITQSNVSALLGPYNSSVGASTVPIAEKYGVPYLITNSNADEILHGEHKYAFRANHANSDAAKNMVDFTLAMSERGPEIKKVAIVADNSDWGVGMAEALKDLANENGLECNVYEIFETNSADLSPIVIKIKQDKPDIVYAMCYLADAQLFTSTMAEYRVDSLIFADGAGFVTSDYLSFAGDAAEGILATNGWHVGLTEYKGEVATALNEQYKTEYSDGTNMNEFSASGWLNATIMCEIIERAGSADREEIRTALANFKVDDTDYSLSLHAFQGIDFQEVRGMINQNIYSGKIITQCQNGEYVLVGPTTLVKTGNFIWPVK